MSNKIRPIAFYLPQFYPTPENDEWWEPGFTEWTNVAKARPVFKGHYQPRIPQELSFYDLRVPSVRERQAELAREAGIEGFCYWHYWFGNGKRLLSEVFKEVVKSGKPDFPFCLCWANHSWYQKTWDPNSPDKLLMEQTYPGVEDYTAHFNEMLPAFKDARYLRTSDGRLIFGVFDFDHFTDFPTFKEIWNKLAKDNGLKGFEFFAFVQGPTRLANYKEGSFDRVVYDALNDTYKPSKKGSIKYYLQAIKSKLGYPVRLADYADYVNAALKRFKELPNVTPCINPMFDHSPRSNNRGIILHNDSPELWGKLCKESSAIVSANEDVDNLLFIKAWNEWGEGNYMEPDRKFGRAYIEEARKIFK